jgi:hypothetical protein
MASLSRVFEVNMGVNSSSKVKERNWEGKHEQKSD